MKYQIINQTCICKTICHKFTAFINITDFPVKKQIHKYVLFACYTCSNNYSLQNTKLGRVKACYKYKVLLDFFCSGIQFNLLLSPYPCFISLLYLDLYVLGDDALIS